MVSHTPGKFGGYRLCNSEGSGDIIFLVYHVILEDRLT